MKSNYIRNILFFFVIITISSCKPAFSPDYGCDGYNSTSDFTVKYAPADNIILQFIDNKTNNPLDDVNVEVYNQSNEKVEHGSVDISRNGGYWSNVLLPATYSIKFIKSGYKDKTIIFSVPNCEVVKITLDHIE